MNASIAPNLPQPPSSLDLAFGFRAGSGRARDVAFVILALAIHGGVSLIHAAAPTAPAVTAVTEIELPPVSAPEPEPEPPKLPEVKPDEPVAAKVAAPPLAPSAPQAARAGVLMTAKESATAPKQGELVDFVTDPSGTSYGSGVVARGGTADHGALGATAGGTGTTPSRIAAAPQQNGGLVDPANLSRRAALKEPNACAGYYPSEADADSGLVTLAVVVRADGTVATASVVAESPTGQGFGKAARACLQSKHFEPSLDRAGAAVAAATTIRLRFVR